MVLTTDEPLTAAAPHPPLTHPVAPADGIGARLVRNSLALFSTQLVTWGLTFCVSLVLPRYLGPTTAGSLYFASSVINLFNLTLLTAHGMLVTKAIARTPEAVAAWLSNALAIRVGIGTVSLAATLAGVAALGYPAETLALVALMGIASLLATFVDLVGAIYQGLQWMSLQARALIAGKVLGAAATLALVFWQRGIVEITAVGVPLALAQAAIIGLPLWRRGYRAIRPRWSMMRGIVTGSMPLLLSDLCLLVYAEMNTVLLRQLAGEQAVAYYAVPMRLLGTVLFVPTILIGAAFPVLAQLYRVDQAAMQRQARRVLVAIMACATPLALLFSLHGPTVVHLLYGDGYAAAGPVLQALGLVVVSVYLNTFVGRLLIAIDRQRAWTAVMIVAVALALPINAFIIGQAQARGQASLGAALALLLSECAMTIPGLLILHRYHLARACLGVLAKAAVATLAAALIMLALTPALGIVSFAPGMLGYLAVAWWLRIVPTSDIRRALDLARPLLPAPIRRRLASLMPEDQGGDHA